MVKSGSVILVIVRNENRNRQELPEKGVAI